VTPPLAPHAHRRPWALGLLSGAGLGAVALGALAAFGWIDLPRRTPLDERLRQSRRNAIVRAVEKTRRSVVTIRVEGTRRVEDARSGALWFPFAPGRMSTYQWVGSGFFIDADGYVLTNDHVIDGARSIMLSLGDATHGVSVQAELVGTAPQFDLALLRVPAAALANSDWIPGDPLHLEPVTFGDSHELMVGEWAIAIGSPFGYELGSTEPSVSVGVISAVQRDLPGAGAEGGLGPYLAMIQTDAAIHVGNSGGPLLNANGEVIGVNTVSVSSWREGTGGGIHFAIPINTARWVARELRTYGEVRKPWIGWTVSEVAPEVQNRLAIPETEGFLQVTDVLRDSPAHRAGIRPGDYLNRIQGLDPYSRTRAERILFGTPVDTDIDVQLLRDGQLIDKKVHVIEDPYTRAEREARSRRPLG
jgi:serine protease Do